MDEFAEVLTRYSQPIRALNWVLLPDSGGLSGALILRGDLGGEPLFCAKRYPADVVSADLLKRHRWLAIVSDLEFVPRLLATDAGETLAALRGHLWEIHDWMPGRADFASSPSPTKLDAACDAVLQLHDVWRRHDNRVEPSRAIRNRLAVIAKWRSDPPPIRTPLDARAAAAISRHLDRAESQLRLWEKRPLPCQPCVRDLRHDHFLFDGDRLTGLIDYGAADWDTPATDAARMLGELAGTDAGLYALGIGRMRGDWELIRALDLAGTLGSAITWVRRLGETSRASVPTEKAHNTLTPSPGFAAEGWGEALASNTPHPRPLSRKAGRGVMFSLAQDRLSLLLSRLERDIFDR